ncbi:MAG: hypothetical protein COA94_08565 [Rickettsiales bacterium]|nr:MAG: hypothetical protein COA94_08565 [Rickettsiales bacterium]
MKLELFMKITEMTIPTLSKFLGISQTQATQYLYKNTMPRPENMQKIHSKTIGLVAANDFYGTTPEKLAEILLKDKKITIPK